MWFPKIKKKGPGFIPDPLEYYLYLTTARIDITTRINVTIAGINCVAATRIDYITAGFRGFSIRTIGIFWFFMITHTITSFILVKVRCLWFFIPTNLIFYLKITRQYRNLIFNSNPTLWYCQSPLSKNIDERFCLYVLVSPLFVEQLVKVSERN